MTRVKSLLILVLALPVFFILLACQVNYVLERSSATPSATRSTGKTPTKATGVPTTSADLPALPTSAPLAIPTAAPLPTPVPPPPTITATSTGNLRIRQQPSTSSPQIGTLKEGESAEVVGRTAASDWVQIIVPSNPSQRGWISAQFATMSGPLESIPVAGAGSNPPPPAKPTSRPGPYPAYP